MALPGISAPAMCTTFRAQAQKIWVDLSRAHRRGRPRSEETITENFLDEIQDAHPQQMFTYSFNKREEGYTGADWEWWLTDDHEWLGLLIQAKRLSSRSHKYEGIKRWSPGAGMAQIDAVLQQAKWKSIDALYCFYNYDSSSPGHLSWNCNMPLAAPAMFGCTVALAQAVKGQLYLGGAGLPKMSAISFPLGCLVCCPALASRAPRWLLPRRAEGVIQGLRALSDAASEMTPVAADRPGLRREPPSYVRRLLDAPLDGRGPIIEELRREAGSIGTLVIIREPREG